MLNFQNEKIVFLDNLRKALPDKQWDSLIVAANKLDKKVECELYVLYKNYSTFDPNDVLKLPDPRVRIRLQERARMAIILEKLLGQYQRFLLDGHHNATFTFSGQQSTTQQD